MSIALSEDQKALAESVAAFTARHATSSSTRACFEGLAAGIWPASWRALAEQNLLGLHLPAEFGGDGAGLVELAIVLEETTFGLLPGPLLPTVLTSLVISRHGGAELRERMLPGFVAGRTGACATDARGLTATRCGDGWEVRGTTVPVLGALSAQTCILGAERADDTHGTVWFVVEEAQRDELAVTRLRSVDLTRDIGEIEVPGIHVRPDRVLDLDSDRLRSTAAALFCAESAGAARWCQVTGLSYAKVREQFGRPIAAFQAIKHKCARLFVRSELIAAAAWDAAVAYDQDPDQFTLAAASAAVVWLPGAVDIGLETVTLFGGIGYTWEHDTHLYWRRAMSLQNLLGPGRSWDVRLGQLARKIERKHDVKLEDEPADLRRWVADQLAAAASLPADQRRAFISDQGLVAPHYPRPYGIAASPVAQVVISQEFERAGLIQPSTTVGEWALPTILAHGTDEQRETLVGATLRGDISWCQLFSEPGAGSDLASLRTRATRAEGGWLLNGQKVWTSQAKEANWSICLARTDPDAPKHKGLSYFLVDMRSPGLEVRPLREANGGYLFNEVFFNDVFVPDSRVIGEPGEGWRLARTTLGNERVNIAVGSGRRRDLPADYLAIFAGDPPPDVMQQVGVLTADVNAFAALGQRSLLRQISGLQPGAEASVLKVAASWNLTNLRSAVMAWHGAEAAVLDEGGGASMRYLSVPASLIGGGTLEIQLNVIGELVLGMPRT
ncbi:MAG TPA: acyl-CoA dehydrogenase [Streptosporangiaceae bacterium]|nr:acyl-CoA dehydrogenase [Streptosporangiaceae bacterium]